MIYRNKHTPKWYSVSFTALQIQPISFCSSITSIKVYNCILHSYNLMHLTRKLDLPLEPVWNPELRNFHNFGRPSRWFMGYFTTLLKQLRTWSWIFIGIECGWSDTITTLPKHFSKSLRQSGFPRIFWNIREKWIYNFYITDFLFVPNVIILSTT